MAGDFEEKYLLLRDENTVLKRKKNEQEATIKRMFTKLAIIEESMKKKKLAGGEDNQDEQDGAASGGGVRTTANGTAAAGLVPVKRDLDTEKFVQSLKSENMQLRKKNQALMEKNRVLEEKMRQHQLKYHSNPKAPSASATNASMGASSSGMAMRKTSGVKVHGAAKRSAVEESGPLERQVDNARRVHRDHLSGDLEMALKNRLVIAEKQLVKLQSENEQLRKRSSTIVQRRSSDGNNNNSGSDDDAGDELHGGRDARISSMDVEHLRRELRDRQAQVAILNARYENLEANNAAEREIQEQTIEHLEHMNRQVHKLRSQLQDMALEKEDLEVRLSKASDLEREITMLRDQNRKLEDRMTSLCESPFINDAFQRKERIDKLFDLEKLSQQQKATIAHMTEEHQKLQGTIKELQSNVKLMKQAKEAVEQDVDKLRQQLTEERNARSLATMTSYPTITAQPVRDPSPKRPSPISTHTAIQPERRDAASSPLKGEQPPSFVSSSASSAMPVVTRRYPDQTLSGSLFMPAEGGSDANSIKHLRNRVHVLQLAHLKAIQELERCEKMLHAQTSINRELAQEIDELTTKNVSSSGALQKRIKQLELAADDRQQRIQLLEAQNRQLKYAREKLLRAQETDKKLSEMDLSSDDEDDGVDVASLSESLVMAARDLSPGEQLLEIWIIGATFDRTVISSNSSTFVLCDFYDFESQSTPLLVGNRPEYNFSSTFRVTIDAFFLRYLASELLVFELHQAIQGDFRLVGRASVSLASLLRSKGVIKEPELPIKLAFGTEHDNVIGTLNAVVRLAAPISEIWKLHLRSYPQDIQLLRKHSLAASAIDPVDEYLLEDGYNNNHEKAVNELQITVFACRGLRSYGKKKKSNGDVLSTAPSSYVHYQILGFPDVFTNIVPSSTSPEFDLHVSKQFFAVEVDACLLHFFSKFQLWFTVFDDQATAENDDTSDGTIGRCSLLLEELVKGESLRGWFQLRDHNDQPAGDISVLIEWKDPFQVAQLYSSSRRLGSSRPAADLNSLDYDQQHAVMRMFAPDMDGRVNYRQFLTYALPPESLELVTSKVKERIEYAIDTEQIVSVEDLFIPAANAQNREQPLKEITASEFRKRIERFGAFVSEAEMELVERVFTKRRAGTTSGGDSPKLRVHYLKQHINPRITCAERLLLHKIRHTLRVFLTPDRLSKKLAVSSPSQPFERFDHAQSGYVSRAEFKRCLGVLGFELLDIDKSYKDFMEKESQTAATQLGDNDSDVAKVTPGDAKDLNEEGLKTGSNHSQTTSSRPSSQAKSTSNAALAASKPTERKVETTNQAAPDPRTEFDRRKEVFLERMKVIASSSAKSLVYEQLEKQKGDRRRLVTEPTNAGRTDQSSSTPLSDRVHQQLTQLHVPKALHHDAARILQRKFRNYRVRQAAAVPASSTQARDANESIVHIDAQLQRMLKTWTREELESLEANMIEAIETELSDARKSRVISRKQFGFVLSKIPRIALEPDLLRQLATHFVVSSKNEQGNVAYQPLVHFICSVDSDPKKEERGLVPVLQVLFRVQVDATQARETMTLVGDVNHTGRMSVKRFREALKRVGLQLSAKDLRVLIVLLSDSKGCDVFYLVLIKLMRDSPAAVKLRQVVARCVRFGLTRLREMLVTRVNSDDGRLSREQLHAVLMQKNAEVNCFEPADSYTLMELAKSSSSLPSSDRGVSAEGALRSAQISIDNLALKLEQVAASEDQPIRDDDLNAYKLPQLQQIAMSSRALICSPYSEMLEAFERFDWKESGLVSLAQFEAVVPRIGFVLFTAQQITNLAKNFGTKTKGSFGVNYRQFLDWTTPSVTPEIESIEAKLRQFVAGKSSEQVKITKVLENWREAFSAMDKLSSGFVTRGEFAKICHESLRLPLSSDELRALLFTYDRNMDDNVDYGSFVQLNWKETSRQVAMQHRKQVQLEQGKSALDETLGKLRRALLSNKVTIEDVARVVSDASAGQDEVDRTQFIVCIKQLGALISPREVESIFAIYGSQNGGGKLHLVQFAGSALRILSRITTSKEDAESRLSKEDEDQLCSAVLSAIKYSRKDFDRACSQLEEFCVVYNHGDIAARKLWKHMERSGLAALLSKKGSSLLIQKYSVGGSTKRRDAKGESSDEDEEEAVRVSLQGVSKWLRESSKHQTEASELSQTIDASQDSGSLLTAALAAVRQLHGLCEAESIDFQGLFEQIDRQYSGLVPALDFKSVLLENGFSKTVDRRNTSTPTEALIGVLVREFRAAEARDGVQYATMLTRALILLEPQQPSPTWFPGFANSLRARIRLRAGFQSAISIEQSIPQLCKSLDSVFDHFDRNRRGFLGQREIAVGLTALKYELSSEQIQYFLQIAGVFRHNTGSGGLSRMEFDSFVLDPSAVLLLRGLADLLYKPSAEDPSKPCVAQLSRLFITRDQPEHTGVLPVSIACKCIADATQRELSSRDQHRLQILFDVNRDGFFAYKLFMKVMSQWHITLPSQGSASVSTRMSSPQAQSQPSSRPFGSTTKTPTPSFQCSRDDVIRALYNQLSSVDFDSQIEIFEDYLRRHDEKRSGSILNEDLERILDQIGLKLSKDAIACLQNAFQDKDGGEDSRINYKKVLKAIQRKYVEDQEQ